MRTNKAWFDLLKEEIWGRLFSSMFHGNTHKFSPYLSIRFVFRYGKTRTGHLPLKEAANDTPKINFLPAGPFKTCPASNGARAGRIHSGCREKESPPAAREHLQQHHEGELPVGWWVRLRAGTASWRTGQLGWCQIRFVTDLGSREEKDWAFRLRVEI